MQNLAKGHLNRHTQSRFDPYEKEKEKPHVFATSPGRRKNRNTLRNINDNQKQHEDPLQATEMTNMDRFIKNLKKDQKKMYRDLREELNLPPPNRTR